MKTSIIAAVISLLTALISAAPATSLESRAVDKRDCVGFALFVAGAAPITTCVTKGTGLVLNNPEAVFHIVAGDGTNVDCTFFPFAGAPIPFPAGTFQIDVGPPSGIFSIECLA